MSGKKQEVENIKTFAMLYDELAHGDFNFVEEEGKEDEMEGLGYDGTEDQQEDDWGEEDML